MYETWLDLFRLGFNIGIMPDELLDMPLDVLGALIQGYRDRIIDDQSTAAQIGYWCAYYQSKHPRNINDVASEISESKYKTENEIKKGTVEDLDAGIKRFEELESRRQKTMDQWKVE